MLQGQIQTGKIRQREQKRTDLNIQEQVKNSRMFSDGYGQCLDGAFHPIGRGGKGKTLPLRSKEIIMWLGVKVLLGEVEFLE